MTMEMLASNTGEIASWVIFVLWIIFAVVVQSCNEISACPPEPLVKPRVAKEGGDPIGKQAFDCPYCGKEMKDGYARIYNWGEISMSVDWHDSCPKASLFREPKVDAVLWEIGGSLNPTSIRCAHRCQECGMVAIEMGN
jgi:predicted RNA-binding Zn-ribbon protein involved in translation (DUF1610 family)